MHVFSGAVLPWSIVAMDCAHPSEEDVVAQEEQERREHSNCKRKYWQESIKF